MQSSQRILTTHAGSLPRPEELLRLLLAQEADNQVDGDELVEKVRHFLDNPSERDAIARAGHARTVAEHTYERRISEILEKLRPLKAKRIQSWALSAEALAAPVEQHRRRGVAG